MNIRRKLAATVAAAGILTSGVALASPAMAAGIRPDSTTQHCDSYHSWTECLTYNYSDGEFTVAAYNGYDVAEYEDVWIGGIASASFTIPSGDWGSYSVSAGAPSSACAGIGSVTIVCGSY